jgi:DNA-binding MarR family transcriptional regulator
MNTFYPVEDIRLDNTAMTGEIIKLFHKLGQIRMKYGYEQWRKLDVPLAQLKSLFLIHMRGSVNVRTLAAEMGVTPSNVTGIVDRLVAQGLVKRSEGLDDRRIVLLEVTDKGRETITEIHETGNSYLKGVLERMDSEDIAALVKGMSTFITAIELDQQEKIVKM